MLEFQDIKIGYKEVLFRVPDMQLNKGQLVTLIGPNGSGKTTFLNTVLGLQQPVSGKLFFNGGTLDEMTKGSKASLLSHVSSKFSGVNYLSVYDLIAMGRAPYTNMLNVLTAADDSVVNRVMDQLDLQGIATKSTTEISDGERQIAMIGKALAQETEIIILDEPTAFLDYNNRRKVVRILKSIALEQNKLIILTSHDLELCFGHSDKVLGVDKNNKLLKVFDSAAPKEQIIQEIFGKY